MDDQPMRCSRCTKPIEADRAAAYAETLDPASPEPRLCADCANEVPPMTYEAIRRAPEVPEWLSPPPAEDQQTPAPAAPPGAPAAEPAPDEPADQEEPAEDDGDRPPASTAEALDAILRQLRFIARGLEYEEFSIWNIFGGLVQIGVLALLFWSYFKGLPDLLMWALVMQVMALTFFMRGKK